MEITTKRKSLMGTFNYIIILPVFFIGIVMAGISYILIKKNVYYEIRSGMENEAYTLANTYDVMYPGYYELVKAENLMALKKGEHYLTNDFIDNIKEDTGLEITIFYNDIRMITTLYSDNKRITGSKMNSAIKKDVLDNGYSKFYDDVRIEEERFFAYYLPVHNGSENIIGAICILKPANQIHSKFAKQVIPLIAIIIAGVVIITYLNYLYFGKLNKNFKHIRNFLGEVTGGNLKAEMNREALAREDEIGDVAKASVNMQRSLRNLIVKDSLTDLYNRRYCNQNLKNISEQYIKTGEPYTLAIADIDFFKKVNDTYGHIAGDEVLVSVAQIMKKSMAGKGFAARWGGEEFLLVYTGCDMETTLTYLEMLVEAIREMRVEYDDKAIKITISIGVATGNGDSVDKVLCTADDRLYHAKKEGRDRVVSD
ncbi:response regulator/GGDEF domain protein [Eshraghiella crossota CAG:259]|uniref:Response regulator/GGDEF domain protein n=1 Tax=Eshraghiella crossota CAG:259 TaxID=1263062 RepID=R5LDM7_9FIRM|nr:response regulator/GGDEF domain protein [Butyrivibrio crossotus CAG:259]